MNNWCLPRLWRASWWWAGTARRCRRWYWQWGEGSGGEQQVGTACRRCRPHWQWEGAGGEQRPLQKPAVTSAAAHASHVPSTHRLCFGGREVGKRRESRGSSILELVTYHDAKPFRFQFLLLQDGWQIGQLQMFCRREFWRWTWTTFHATYLALQSSKMGWGKE